MSTGNPAAQADLSATGVLSIDLAAIRANYRALAERAERAECAAVVKADAYGTGAARVVPALLAEGCRAFFVATPAEAREVRGVAPDVVLYVLDGLLPGTARLMHETSARPVLGSLAEIEEWAAFCRRQGTPLPAAIHIDTGMNRLGLPSADVDTLARDASLLDDFELTLVMSHLACADDPDHPKNAAQLDAFDRLRARLPPVPASLANSGGILLGPAFHYDLVRPGIALYGGNPLSGAPNPMRPVVRLQGRIAQIRDAPAGDTVGYGATQTLDRPARLATVTVGYADGYFRLLGAGDGVSGAVAYIGDHAAPLVGRVSMDLITLDVSGVPAELVHRGGMVELLGPHISVDDLAAKARTIGYEVLTGLGRRAERRYIE